MYDPLAVAHEIRYPWRDKPTKLWPEGYRQPFITIWHRDPERDGTDDSCGWFIRGRHVDQKKLQEIITEFEFNWDRSWTTERGHTYYCGYFQPDGMPNMAVHAIVLNLFFSATYRYYNHNRNKAIKFIQNNLVEILLFAENPTDSLSDGIRRKFEIGCREEQTEQSRKERIERMASCIYTWILRANRPWWRHPRWHVHHWRIQFHPYQNLKRRYWDKCDICGKRGYPNGVSMIGNWDGTKHWHSTCEKSNDKL